MTFTLYFLLVSAFFSIYYFGTLASPLYNSKASKLTQPSYEPNVDYSNTATLHSALKLLQQYGYLKEEIKIGELDADDVERLLKESISRFQEYFELPVDGKLSDVVSELLYSSRCVHKDIQDDQPKGLRRKRFTYIGSRWSRMPILVSFVRYHKSLSKEAQDMVLHVCLKMWTKHSSLKFVVRPSSFANIMLSFRKIDGPFGVVGQGESPGSGGLTPIHLDSEENWRLNNYSPVPGAGLTWAVCHELGHTLGLGHSRHRDAIMFPFAQRHGDRDHTLGKDDVQGIHALYGFPDGEPAIQDLVLRRDVTEDELKVLGEQQTTKSNPTTTSKTTTTTPTTTKTTKTPTTTTTAPPTTTTTPTTTTSPTTSTTTTSPTTTTTTTTTTPTTTATTPTTTTTTGTQSNTTPLRRINPRRISAICRRSRFSHLSLCRL